MNSKTQTVITRLNADIRAYEGKAPFDQIRYSLAGWAEVYATNLFDVQLSDIDPELADLLYRIKGNRGAVGHDDAMVLIDYGIAALDLRAPEDREGGE